MATDRRLSAEGLSLYQTLGIPKNAKPEDIRRQYRKKALMCHPDKNPNNPQAEEEFKRINYANSILSDESSKEIYDKFGSFGIQTVAQCGKNSVKVLNLLSSCWFKCFAGLCFVFTGFCCCICCCCCCGKCPTVKEDQDVPDLSEFEDEKDVQTRPPKSGPTPFAMPPTETNDFTEATALNPSEGKTTYVEDNSHSHKNGPSKNQSLENIQSKTEG